MELYLAQVWDSKEKQWFNLVKGSSKENAKQKVLKHHREKYGITVQVHITEIIK